MAADPDVKLLSTAAWDRLERMLLWFERGADKPPTARRPRVDLRDRPPARVILLDNLDSEGTADAAVTIPVETTEVQEVAIVGTATGGTFKLAFDGSETIDLSWNISAEAMQAALEQLESIGAGNVLVSIGTTTGETPHNPGVWLVAFIGKFADTDVPLLTATDSTTGVAIITQATTHWIDSGEIETVHNMIPVGSPTPARAGAVALVLWYPGLGYGVHACECRDFVMNYM
ncbi:MAG: hypothetical protein EXS05_18005 [Planctomycetaceae bacterium]|nr:hypothetical protein [Planctomycetaceae bacterium]